MPSVDLLKLTTSEFATKVQSGQAFPVQITEAVSTARVRQPRAAQ